MKRSQPCRLKMRHKLLWTLLTLCLASVQTEAAQVNLLGGYYSLSAKTSRSEGKDSNLGIYQISYQTELMPHMAIQLGYSLLMTQTISGDMGFGPDINLMYFPLTSTEGIRVQSDRIVLLSSELLRPYFGIGFHQRQFQSVSATYVGFGTEAGLNYSWNPQYDLKAALRMMMLRGPSQAEATQVDLLLGLSFKF